MPGLGTGITALTTSREKQIACLKQIITVTKNDDLKLDST